MELIHSASRTIDNSFSKLLAKIITRYNNIPLISEIIVKYFTSIRYFRGEYLLNTPRISRNEWKIA